MLGPTTGIVMTARLCRAAVGGKLAGLLTTNWRHIHLYSPSKPHRGDQAGSAHTVKAPAFPIPSDDQGGRVCSTVLDGVGTSDRA